MTVWFTSAACTAPRECLPLRIALSYLFPLTSLADMSLCKAGMCISATLSCCSISHPCHLARAVRACHAVPQVQASAAAGVCCEGNSRPRCAIAIPSVPFLRACTIVAMFENFYN